jgi:hypothetical protein
MIQSGDRIGIWRITRTVNRLVLSTTVAGRCKYNTTLGLGSPDRRVIGRRGTRATEGHREDMGALRDGPVHPRDDPRARSTPLVGEDLAHEQLGLGRGSGYTTEVAVPIEVLYLFTLDKGVGRQQATTKVLCDGL